MGPCAERGSALPWASRFSLRKGQLSRAISELAGVLRRCCCPACAPPSRLLALELEGGVVLGGRRHGLMHWIGTNRRDDPGNIVTVSNNVTFLPLGEEIAATLTRLVCGAVL